MTIAEKLTAIAENEPKVYAAGQKAQQERFWEIFQGHGSRTTYNRAFYSPMNLIKQGIPAWTDETFRPIYPIICDTGNSCALMFVGTEVTSIHVPVIVRDGGTGNAVSTGTFQNNPKLHTITSLEVAEGTKFTNWFTGDTALRNITMSGVISEDISFADCPLTNASVQTVIDTLKDLTGTTAKTLTLSPLTGGALTQAQKTAIAAKNWNLVH